MLHYLSVDFSTSESEVRSVSHDMSRYNCPHYFLLGSTPTEDDLSITGAKLPTVRQVLLCFLASHASPVTVRAAAKATLVKVLPFYDKARIPTLNPVKMEEEVLKLHTEMKNLLKIDHQHRETEKNKTKFNNFKQKLEKTMKFWPRDTLERIKIEENRKCGKGGIMTELLRI